jgi:hypothetical protein
VEPGELKKADPADRPATGADDRQDAAWWYRLPCGRGGRVPVLLTGRRGGREERVLAGGAGVRGGRGLLAVGIAVVPDRLGLDRHPEERSLSERIRSGSH